MSSLSPEQISLIAAQVTGNVSGVPKAVDPTELILQRVWHVSAVVIFVGGIAGGIVMARRGWTDAEKGFSIWSPSTWTVPGFFSIF